jgi:hypothetical protein
MKMSVLWAVAPCSLVQVYQRIALMMEAAGTSELGKLLPHVFPLFYEND